MGTYIISFIIGCIALSCIFGKKRKERAYQILFISAALAIIPTTIVNGKANNNSLRVKSITTSLNLDSYLFADTINNDTCKLYFKISGDDICVYTLEGDDKTNSLDEVSIYFIEADSLNNPRYEIVKDKVVKDSWWYSKLGIPAKNRHTNIYLPKDNEELFNRTFYENKKS